MKYRKSHIIYGILTIAVLAVIWANSMKDAKASTEMSRSVLAAIIEIFHLPMTEHVLRKLAHAFEFTVLGFLVCSTLWRTDCFVKRSGSPYLKALPLSVLLGLLAALGDETIQLFSEGRSSQVTDVWIDLGGVTAGVLATGLILLLRKRAEKRKAG